MRSKVNTASPPKNPRMEVGHVFLVPLLDGTYALGQICWVEYHSKTLAAVATALFAHRSPDPGYLTSLISEPSRFHKPLMVMMSTAGELVYSIWPILGKAPVRYDNFDVSLRVSSGGVDKESVTSSSIYLSLEMYWGIRPWDAFYDPQDIDKHLLEGFQVPPYPPHARFKKDFTEEELVRLEDRDWARQRGNLKKWPRRRGGSKTIHIQYCYEGAGLPSVDELRRRHALERKLGEMKAGTIDEAGGGEGVMDVFVSTRDVDKSRPNIDKALTDMGISEATITIE